MRHAGVMGVAPVGRASQGRWVFRLVGARVIRVLGEHLADAAPCGGDGAGPAPSGVYAQSDLSGAVGDAGGDVHDPVAEGVNLTARQAGMVGEADESGPGRDLLLGQQATHRDTTTRTVNPLRGTSRLPCTDAEQLAAALEARDGSA